VLVLARLLVLPSALAPHCCSSRTHTVAATSQLLAGWLRDALPADVMEARKRAGLPVQQVVLHAGYLHGSEKVSKRGH
jgi:hypothetical protein